MIRRILLIAALALGVFGAQAQVALTTEQRQVLKAHVQANGDTNAAFVNGNLQQVAELMNAPASPSITVWRTAVTQDEITQNGFDWVRVDNLSVGKARIWDWLFRNATQSINPSKANVRAGIDEAWKGTQADLDVRAAVYAHCKRLATRLEALFATGTGSNAIPATLGIGAAGAPIEGQVQYTLFVGL